MQNHLMREGKWHGVKQSLDYGRGTYVGLIFTGTKRKNSPLEKRNNSILTEHGHRLFGLPASRRLDQKANRPQSTFEIMGNSERFGQDVNFGSIGAGQGDRSHERDDSAGALGSVSGGEPDHVASVAFSE